MVVTRTIRNRFVGDEPARGFESHRLRQSSASTRKRVVEALLFCSFLSRVEVASILPHLYKEFFF